MPCQALRIRTPMGTAGELDNLAPTRSPGQPQSPNFLKPRRRRRVPTHSNKVLISHAETAQQSLSRQPVL